MGLGNRAASLIASLAIAVPLWAQPPAGKGDRPEGRGREGRGPEDRGPEGRGPEGRGEGRGPEGRGPGRPPNPMLEALDANHDGVISAEEILAAPTALKALDRNSDGKLTEEELRPRGPEGPGGEGRGPGGEGRGPGREGRGPNVEDTISRLMEMDKNKDGKLTKEEVSERMQGLIVRADENKDGVVTKEELMALVQRENAGGGGQRGPGGPGGPGGGPGFGGPGGPPGGGIFGNPAAFIDRLFEFDADKDGKLSREELAKMGDMFGRGRRPEGGPEGRPDGGRRPEGGPEGGRRPEGGEGRPGGARPPRPE